jgi:peptide/nickel transport system substrate-binding protein
LPVGAPLFCLASNVVGFSSSRIDGLLPMIQTEIDEGKRQAMVDEVHKIIQDEVAYVPMYVQPLIWADL